MTLDQQIFYFINTDCANSALDWLAPMWREKSFWLPFYVFLVSFFALNFGEKGWLTVAALILTVAFANLLSSELIKKTVQRLRPCNDRAFRMEVILRLPSCGSGYSFPSSHATNHFAAAMFLSLVFGKIVARKTARRVRFGLFFWAGSVAILQVYVGVHYPFDIFCGGILGAAVGWFGYQFYRFWLNYRRAAEAQIGL